MKIKEVVIWVFVLLFMFFTKAFGAEPTGYDFKKIIETGKTKVVRTNIDFLAGKLFITGSTENLAECYYGRGFLYLKPEMTYHEAGKTGYLNIETKKLKGQDWEDFDDNRWDLLLNPNISNSIAIKLNAGEANIDLSGCNLNRFDYRMTAGESSINLQNTSVPFMLFNMMAGEAEIDLTGKWHNDLEAEIKGGVGKLNLKVPYDYGVRVFVNGLIGEAKLPFFNRKGKVYVNDAFGKSKHTLYINIDAGIGEINVTMEE